MAMDFWEKFWHKSGARVKVPTVLQMEATECGAASLAMVLAHYGLWVPLEKLRSECGVNRDGSKASNVMRAAKARGCEVHGYRWEAESLREEQDYPLIIHWEFNHFLVLEGIRGDKVYLNDPAMGRRTVYWDEFVTSYTGIALTIRPGAGFQPAGHRYNVFKAVAQKLWQDKWGMEGKAAELGMAGVCFLSGEDPQWESFLKIVFKDMETGEAGFKKGIHPIQKALFTSEMLKNCGMEDEAEQLADQITHLGGEIYSSISGKGRKGKMMKLLKEESNPKLYQLLFAK
jgi:hypothetical protein